MERCQQSHIVGGMSQITPRDSAGTVSVTVRLESTIHSVNFLAAAADMYTWCWTCWPTLIIDVALKVYSIDSTSRRRSPVATVQGKTQTFSTLRTEMLEKHFGVVTLCLLLSSNCKGERGTGTRHSRTLMEMLSFHFRSLDLFRFWSQTLPLFLPLALVQSIKFASSPM